MTGTTTLLRIFWRRDRWLVLWFALGTALLYVSQAWSVDGLYATQAEFERAAADMARNSALVAMAGPARALDTTGGQVTWQASAFGAVVVGLMVMAIVVRHTRAEEESGRDELLRAAPVGRHATSAAALVVAATASVVLGAAVWAALVAYGLAVADSAGLGVGVALCGWTFAGVALLASQLTSSARAAYGLSGAAIGAAYALRAVGDVGASALSWCSPIGWYQATHPFSGLRWWPGLLLLGAAVLAAVAATLVFDRRDFGSGVLAARPGPAGAGRGLASGPGLAWRLQRPALLGWWGGLVAAGACFGALGDDVGAVVGDSDLSREVVLQAGGDLVDAFYATLLAMLALLAGAFAISSALRPRTEERAGRLEPLLATGLPRSRWLAGHVLVTLGGTLAVVLGAGAALGSSYALVTGDAGAGGRLAAASLAYLPGALVLAGFARLLHGVAPRLASGVWLLLGLAWVVLVLGQVLHLPQWLRDLSPYEHLAAVPAVPVDWTAVLALTVLAAALSAVGQAAFARRDVGSD